MIVSLRRHYHIESWLDTPQMTMQVSFLAGRCTSAGTRKVRDGQSQGLRGRIEGSGRSRSCRLESPERGHWLFVEFRRWAAPVGEPYHVKKRLGLRIIGHGDLPSAALRPIESIPAIRAVTAAGSIGRAHATGAPAASAAALSAGAPGTAVRRYGERTSLRIN